MLRELASYGVNIPRRCTGRVHLRPGPQPGRCDGADRQDARTQGVTTIIPVWDPLYPILITKEATNQLYFPEWLMIGTGLSDTTVGGPPVRPEPVAPRLRHLPALGHLGDGRQVRRRREPTTTALPGTPPGDEGVLINIYGARIQTLFRGIHMAGPEPHQRHLGPGHPPVPPDRRPAGRAAGLRDPPEPDGDQGLRRGVLRIQRHGPRRARQRRHGHGHEGRRRSSRYDLGEWPRTEPRVFDLNGAIAVSDDPPGGGDPPHEQDGHTHKTRCLSCPT